MPADSRADSAVTVWASTFVPAKSPIAGYGQDGYSVAWVDTPEGRLQVLVSGPRPVPGAVGRLRPHTLGDTTVDLFEADPA
ncbi:hypothetical protein A9W98_04280 [Mycobacterium gordonae]|uniref:Uncharacterized protein n=1 Tax=Mycobacterium gordonae TaxID=1778 RepID=A0A1A6B728_MYCGO|nr:MULTISPECIES: hypothetical protein [Mycobacterium]MBI2702070.1 hypothetical protein [Mycobacterium sp.]MCQ4360510.1 hypothetical protein [Mycobacterium gordonae]OBR98048.1 hypothetical protein A9W98_04280 [Mycobacterium gordonae]